MPEAVVVVGALWSIQYKLPLVRSEIFDRFIHKEISYKMPLETCQEQVGISAAFENSFYILI